jgi:hypothetical protein
MQEYVKGFLQHPLSKPASALLDILPKLFTLKQLKVAEQTLIRNCIKTPIHSFKRLVGPANGYLI